MDTTQLLYIAGAFLLGFFFAWFMGRSGPKRALEESEANAHSLQRTLDDRARTVTKLEGQLKEHGAQVDRLGGEKTALAARIADFEVSSAAAGEEIAELQRQVSEAESERLRLEAELGHVRGAYADTRTRLVEFMQQTETEQAAAEAQEEVEAAAAEEFVEDVSTALALAEASHTADIKLLTGQVQTLETELASTRAALARTSAQVALRPELTTGKRQEYAALAGEPERIVAALHERDIAVADARNEVDYLRRTIGMMTAMGAELANEVERRRREQQLLVYEVAGLTAVTRSVEMKQLADSQAGAENPPAPKQDDAAAAELRNQLDERTKELEDLKTESGPLQVNLDELQAELEALNAAKADLEAQLEARDTELTETKETLSLLQTDAAGVTAAKSAIEEQLQARGLEWDDLLARINALNEELAVFKVEEENTAKAEAPTESSVETSAPSAEVAALAAGTVSAEVTPQAARAADAAIPVEAEHAVAPQAEAPANTAVAKLAAGVAAAVALFRRKNARLAEYEQQVSTLAGDKGTLESTVAAKEEALAGTQAKVQELQDAISQRSARFDALSMHASGMEAELEIRRLDRTRLEEEVRKVAVSLQELAAVPAAEASAAAPATEVQSAEALSTTPPAEAGAAVAASSGDAQTPSAEASAPSEPAPAVEISSIEALHVGAAAVTGLVHSTQSALEDAQAQLAALQAQLAADNAAKDALAAELESRGVNLSDLQAQFAALQGEYAGVEGTRGDLQTRLQALDGKLLQYLQEYGDPEDLAAAGLAPAAGTDAEAAADSAADAAAPNGMDEQAPAPAADATGAEAAAPARPVDVAGRVAALGIVLKRGKDAFASANARIGELEDEIGALTSQKTDLETQLEQKEQALADLSGQLQSAGGEVSRLTAEVDTLTHQLGTVEAELKATDEERLRLDAQLAALNGDLESLGAAFDSGDTATVSALAAKLMGSTTEAADTAGTGETAVLAEGEAAGEAVDGHANGEATRSMAVPLTASAGAVAVAGAIRKKQLALEETSSQLASVQEEQAALTTAKADLEAQYETQVAALAEAKTQLEALQQQLDAANAAHAEELQVLDQKTAELQAQYNEAEATRLQLQTKVDELTADQEAAMALLAERDSAAQEVETKLEAVTLPLEKTVSDFKAAARAAAESRGVTVRTTTDLQDLSQLKHIGVTFEQRLYRAGAGTFWEVAHLNDDDLVLILRLTEMQQLAMDTNEVRSDAVRLAEESDSVGVLSEGETPDDFEPIQGIGKIFEQRLYSAGIRTYRQLAEMSEAQLAEICQARKPLVPDYSSWIRQARIFLDVRSGGK
jgi:chromosome segregation ATPase